MRKPLNKNWQLNLFLVFGLFYFSSIYPYTHFHRAHNPHSAPDVSGFHQAGAALDRTPRSQEDRDPHHSIDEHVGAFCKTNPQTNRGDCEAGSSFEASLIDIDPDLSRNDWVASDLAATLPPLSCGNRAYPRPPPEFVVIK